MICAALWPDPADPLCPQAFRDEAARLINAFAKKADGDMKLLATSSEESKTRWAKLAKATAHRLRRTQRHLMRLRAALLDFIADFANWDNSTVKEYLETSRALTQAAHEALGGAPGTRPLVVDPFAGGGSIPLEALRVGADAFASDLNPVAVLLNKVVLEYIPKYGQRLADEVRKWGEWIKQEAEKELAEFYPKDPDGATPIAYLWARTIQCEGPGCGAEVPLIRSLWLAKKANRSVALQLVPRAQGQASGLPNHRQATRRLGGPGRSENRNRRPEVRRHGQTRLRHLPVLRLHDAGRARARTTQDTTRRSERCAADVRCDNAASRTRPLSIDCRSELTITVTGCSEDSQANWSSIRT